MSHAPDDADQPHDHNGHDHDHDEDCDHEHAAHEHELDASPVQLSEAIFQARTGLRSDVQELVELLPIAQVYIPLSEDLPDTPEDEELPFEGDLTFRPHMILNEDQSVFAVAFSETEFSESIAGALRWQTSDDELKFICVPSHVAFDLCQMVIEGASVSGLVFNPGTDHELVLMSDEAASLSQGVAIPLVGYVADLPADEDGATQIVEGAEPPPAALLDALAGAKERIKDLLDVQVTTTFNPERDREPHLTITLTIIARHGLDRQALADDVMDDAAPHLPAPGYADIVFLEAPN